MSKKVAIIVVLYESVLEKTLSFDEKTFHLIIVDNTPNRDLNISDTSIIYIPLLRNYGIAKAQNIGIKKAKELKCDYVVFFDQDSVIPNLYVENLLQKYIEAQDGKSQIAIMGPLIVNKDTGKEYNSLLFQDEKLTDGLIFCDNVISSGSIVSIQMLEEIGYLDESLFIDYVDFEWCWRAISKGFLCCRNGNIKLYHMIGNDRIILGRKTSISSPFRCYYQYRNFLILCKRKYVPFNWKIKQFISLSYRFVLFPILLKKGRIYLKYMLQGIKDGVKW